MKKIKKALWCKIAKEKKKIIQLEPDQNYNKSKQSLIIINKNEKGSFDI